MGIAQISRTSQHVSTVLLSLYLFLSLSLSLLSSPSESHTRACLFHFLKCPSPSSHCLRPFPCSGHRSVFPSVTLVGSLHRVYRTTASVWLTVYLKISIRLTRGFGSAPNHRNRICSCFLFRSFSSVNRDN